MSKNQLRYVSETKRLKPKPNAGYIKYYNEECIENNINRTMYNPKPIEYHIVLILRETYLVVAGIVAMFGVKLLISLIGFVILWILASVFGLLGC
jgi:hypothetical protein